MEDLPAFLKRAAERCGFNRDYFIDQNLPTNPDNIIVVHFFGDLRNEFVLSSLLLKRFREELRGSKYMILCTWKGHRGLFPYADEHWFCSDSTASEHMRREALGFDNNSEIYTVQRQNLNYFFHHLIVPEDIKRFYDGGLTAEFHNRLNIVKRFLPMVPSATYLDPIFNQGIVNRPGYKVLLMPTRFGCGYISGRLTIFARARSFGTLC